MWQFPRSKLKVKDYTNADFIIISHFHPDHFCPKSLSHFTPPGKHVLIPDLETMNDCQDYLLKNGFNCTRVKDKQTIDLGKEFSVSFYLNENKIDSSQVINCKSIQKSIYNMNDCFLRTNQLEEIKNRHEIQHSMIFFMGVGPFPGSFDLPVEEKHKIIKRKESSDYLRALQTLELLNTKTFTAYSNDMTWLRRPELVLINGSLKSKFYRFITAKSTKLEPIFLESGDTISIKTGISKIQSKLISTKEEILSEVSVLNKSKSISNQIETIEKKEDSFILNIDKLKEDMKSLLNLFNNDLQSINKQNIKQLYPDHLDQTIINQYYVIKFLLLPEEISFYFIYDHDNHLATLKEDFKKVVPDLILNLPSNLWSSVQNSFYSTEDLMNCRFLIQRDGPFTEIENSFWNAFCRLYTSTKKGINEMQSNSLINN